MDTVAGVFTSRDAAERAAAQLRDAGLTDINLLTPGASEQQIESVPTSDTEQPGMGKAVGGLVGAGLGLAGGLHLGTAAASAVIPGVGPVVAIGLVAAGLLGAGGFAAGAKAGETIERRASDGLPVDELWVYKDALRQGRTVLFVQFHDEDQEAKARDVLAQSGAESIDAARHAWWVGLRSAEQEHYQAQGGDFARDEHSYRAGFQAAQHDNGSAHEAYARYGNASINEQAFCRGYERGRDHRNRPQ
jgi:hypothetical protein